MHALADASQIEAAVLLMYGGPDDHKHQTLNYVESIDHALRMKAALESAKKQVSVLVYHGEGHGIYDQHSNRVVYERLLEFLQQHLHASALLEEMPASSSQQ